MKIKRRQLSEQRRGGSLPLDRKLVSYLAGAASIGAVAASDAKAIVVSNSTVQNIGINGFANIDFNSDGQVDFQIDHDRVDLGGGNILDYLQIDKNDVNGASPGENLFPTDFDVHFPLNGTVANDNVHMAYLVQNPPNSSSVEYPSALPAGAEIGPSSFFDFQEGDNVHATMKTGRFNRLIDEDHGQADMALNGKTADQIFTPTNSPQFVGVQGQTRYLGARLDLNNASGDNNVPSAFTYGWIGIKITNEADATAQVVGYGYETEPGVAIMAGQTGTLAGDYNNNGKVDGADYVLWREGGALQNETVTPGATTIEDFNVWRASFGNMGGPISGAGAGIGVAGVPEPSSLVLGLGMGLGVVCAYLCRRVRGR